MGSIFIVIELLILGLFLIIFLHQIKMLRQAQILQQKLTKSICWNLSIRVFLEASLELSFSLQLNAPYLRDARNSKTFAEVLDYTMTILIGLLLLALPFFIVIFYGVNFGRLRDKNFKD